MSTAIQRLARLGLVLAVIVLAAFGARSVACWNDGSRLAALESLTEHGTLAIDDSVFVRVPPELVASGRAPYPPTLQFLIAGGTLDKVHVGGHFYSDKPPVATFLLAGLYYPARWFGAPMIRERPDWWCWFLALATGGGALVVAVWSLDRIVVLLGLSGWWRIGVTASFVLATMAPTYAEQVNNHILFLGASAALFLQVIRLAQADWAKQTPWGSLALLGSLAGLGYTLDLGCGPVLLLCGLPWLIWRVRRVVPILVVLLAAAPWGILHHGLNYAVCGSFSPINSTPEHFRWPGSPFDENNLTGMLHHSFPHWVVYSLAMLFGKCGFLVHNLPLLMLVPGLVWLWCNCPKERPEIALAAGWPIGCWLLYATISAHMSGSCCSIRWFVPLLAPAYLLLALMVRDGTIWRGPFIVLSATGMVLAASMWLGGPWRFGMVPLLWQVNAVSIAGLLVIAWRRHVWSSHARISRISLPCTSVSR
jgi:hypothetical protein